MELLLLFVVVAAVALVFVLLVSGASMRPNLDLFKIGVCVLFSEAESAPVPLHAQNPCNADADCSYEVNRSFFWSPPKESAAELHGSLES